MMISKDSSERTNAALVPTYGQRDFDEDIPAFKIPDKSSPADVVYRLIRDELNLDGNPSLNLASFVTTWMDDEARRLADDCINKNFIDFDEYPQTAVIHNRVVNMLADLFHAEIPEDADLNTENPPFMGTATIGSSEAIMLGLLAHKWNWRKRNSENTNRSAKDQPYLIFGTDVHTCWDKFARYFDVNVKFVYMQPGKYRVTADDVETILQRRIADDPEIMARCGYSADEVGGRKVAELVTAVGCVVCTTFTGDMDDVAGIDAMLTRNGWDIPIHVDGASGGFVLPFTEGDNGGEAWDFRLPHVASINVSNHKYGLVYPGLGTVLFRNPQVVPEELFFDINYLGGEMHNYSLNFSRASSMVLLQYYNLLRLGREGYSKVMGNCMDNAGYLVEQLKTDAVLNKLFEPISRTDLFPVVAFKFSDDLPANIKFTLPELSHELKNAGWIVPAYTMPANAEEITVMRIVVRENISRDMAEILIRGLKQSIRYLTDLTKDRKESPQGKAPADSRKGYTARDLEGVSGKGRDQHVC
ncbi:MAG: pyridoxal-dependent decarboxylase [Motiliproteus sp.]